MTTQYQATVNLGDSSISATSDNAEDIMRILTLAGMTPSSMATQTPPVEEIPGQEVAVIEPESSCGEIENECSDEEITGEVVEQADYDHGEQNTHGAGHEINPSTYIWKGPKLPQRLVKGFAGDNALVSEVYEKLSNAYEHFLAEEEKRENASGDMSPLSDPTKPEFDKDPLSGKTPVDDGSHSPMSTVKRQPALK